MYSLSGHPRYFKFKRTYQQYGPCFHSRLFSYKYGLNAKLGPVLYKKAQNLYVYVFFYDFQIWEIPLWYKKPRKTFFLVNLIYICEDLTREKTYFLIHKKMYVFSKVYAFWMIYLIGHPESYAEIIVIPEINFNRLIRTCKVINQARLFIVSVWKQQRSDCRLYITTVKMWCVQNNQKFCKMWLRTCFLLLDYWNNLRHKLTLLKLILSFALPTANTKGKIQTNWG